MVLVDLRPQKLKEILAELIRRALDEVQGFILVVEPVQRESLGVGGKRDAASVDQQKRER